MDARSLLELLLLARYPFLPGARAYVQSQGYTVGDLLSDPLFEEARRRAIERIRRVLNGDGLPEFPHGTEPEARTEVLAYALTRVILAQLGDSFLNSKYAVSESKR